MYGTCNLAEGADQYAGEIRNRLPSL